MTLTIRWEGAAALAVKHPATVILEEVATKHGLTVEDIKGPSRKRYVARARQEAMWQMRQRTRLSFPEIARRCGRGDHTTAIHGVKAHEARLAEEQGPA